jgi:hypothetical protein
MVAGDAIALDISKRLAGGNYFYAWMEHTGSI